VSTHFQFYICRKRTYTSLRYWNGHYPPLLRGAVNAASDIGNIIGQLSFGFLGDAFGRRFVYGKELIVCIIGTIHDQSSKQHTDAHAQNDLDLLLPVADGHWNWRRLSYFCFHCVREITSQNERSAAGLDILEPRMGKSFPVLLSGIFH
jgi:hypothetical protein